MHSILGDAMPPYDFQHLVQRCTNTNGREALTPPERHRRCATFRYSSCLQRPPVHLGTVQFGTEICSH
ncbi:uncharacterized protein MYCFIDRAFT_212594 [Pseudocercospora fijiensis CIRAD86]|uniref:Uncharacterized protein n=1 Tax=Pseudocercospora fijiensis (strain CIRAD86) TaxID=383855 RepID=M2ZFL0_PSEFD|nr:uncharacterized protein MYCFIDRAFT_212594 [Pseudocercospora fijiensis CIRAD86]EME77929.1 hypothetical protein MYCFIDRAFT_212594 [Pseudocercospora fijiensis CIRAD86]